MPGPSPLAVLDGVGAGLLHRKEKAQEQNLGKRLLLTVKYKAVVFA